MKDYNRREFIKTGLLATSAFFFSPFEKLNAAKYNNTSGKEVHQLQQKAKAFFYRKEYDRAADCYRQLLALIPTSILAYDGLAKTYHVQNNLLAAAESYRQGWLAYPDNPLFCDRLARSMQRLVIGNNKQAKEFCLRVGETALLEVAAGLYIQYIERQNEQSPAYLQEGLLDVQRSLDKLNRHRKYNGKALLEFTPISKEQINLLAMQPAGERWKKSRRKKKKSEYAVTSETAIKKRENKSKKKHRRSLEFNSEVKSREREQKKNGKHLYYPAFAEALKNNVTTKIEKYQEKILRSDSTDTNAHGQLVRHYRRQKAYSKLTRYQRSRYVDNSSFWNTVSYAQALRLQARKESKPELYSEAEGLYRRLIADLQYSSHEYICVYGGILDCLYGKGQYETLRRNVLRALIPYPLSYLPFVLVYIRSWEAEGAYDLAKAACMMLLSGTESPLLNDDPVYKHLKISHKVLIQPTGEDSNVPGFGVSKESLSDIYYVMVRLYEKQNNFTAARKILNQIKEIDPDNSFVKKRMI